jgi:NAD(P) transhydrogenase subunit alpha
VDFISILSIFVMACFVGYYVVWSVTPALHTPLMAVTNAISSVIIVGALIASAAGSGSDRRYVEMAGAARGGAGQHQHLRRLRGHRADARDVQEEGALMRRRNAEHGPNPWARWPIWWRASASSWRCAGFPARPPASAATASV